MYIGKDINKDKKRNLVVLLLVNSLKLKMHVIIIDKPTKYIIDVLEAQCIINAGRNTASLFATI